MQSTTLCEAMVEQVMATTGKCPAEVSADAGYYSEANLELLQSLGIQAFIRPEKVKHSKWRLQKRTHSQERDPQGQNEMRQISVEPVFGHIKEPMRFRQVPLRGQAGVKPKRGPCGYSSARPST